MQSSLILTFSIHRYQNALRILTTGCPVKSKEALNIGFANDAFCTTATADNNNDNDNSNSSSHGYGGSLAAQVCDDAAQAGSRFLAPFLSVGEPHVIREIKRMTKEVECTTGRTWHRWLITSFFLVSSITLIGLRRGSVHPISVLSVR